MLRVLLCSLPIVVAAIGYDRMSDYDQREYTVHNSHFQAASNGFSQPVSHTFPNRTRCRVECELECTMTAVYIEDVAKAMWQCNRLKPKKETLIASIWSNSFYKTLLVIGAIVVVIIAFLTSVFCCSLCCRQIGSSSRGSSKDALHQNEDEFREILPEEAPKRDFRRPQRTTMAV